LSGGGIFIFHFYVTVKNIFSKISFFGSRSNEKKSEKYFFSKNENFEIFERENLEKYLKEISKFRL